MSIWKVIAILVLLSLAVHLLLYGYMKRRIAAAKRAKVDDRANAKFVVIGIGAGDKKLSYPKNTLAEAGYLASKMADNGVKSVQILDDNGKEYSDDEAWEAFRLSKPEGWTFH